MVPLAMTQPRKAGLFSDCKIILNYSENGKEKNVSKVYEVDGVILQCASAVFEAMLSQNFIEGQNQTIILEDMNPKYFDLFLDFIYENQCILSNTEEACGVYEIANKYLMNTCMDFCVEYIEQNCDIYDSPSLYNFSIFYNRNELRQTLLNAVLLDFDKVEVDTVDENLMSDVLDSPIVYVTEDILMKKLLEWIESKMNQENREDVRNTLIHKYIPKIHFFEIPKEDLSKIDFSKLNENQVNFIMALNTKEPLPSKRIILPRHRICQCNPVTELCSTSSKFNLLSFNSNSIMKFKPPKQLNKLVFTFLAKSDGWIFYHESGNDFIRISIQNGLLCFAFHLAGNDFTYSFHRDVIDGLEHFFCYESVPFPRLYLDDIQYYNTELKNLKNLCSGTIELGGVGYSFEGYFSQIILGGEEFLDYPSSHLFASEVKPTYSKTNMKKIFGC